MIQHAAIVPLIGGLPLGSEIAFGQRPEFVVSYSPFTNHDSQYLQYHNNSIPYYLLDEDGPLPRKSVSVVGATCPCAGLSSLSPSASSINEANDWMPRSAEFVLNIIRPQVFWGENAPRLASKMGEPIVKQLRKIGDANGYTFSLYKTKSLLHGLSQVRDRSFYFFWREKNAVPFLPYFKRDFDLIEDTIRNSSNNNDDPMSIIPNKGTPSEQPFYRYVLEEMHNGITHSEFQKLITQSTGPMSYLESKGVSYLTVAKWMRKNGFNKVADRCEKIHVKLSAGKNIMRKTVEIPKDKIGAFVGHLPMMLTHPDIDRFISIRESLDIMKMPKAFILQGGIKNLNMICQNVPVTTAKDIANAIAKYLNGELHMINTHFMIQDNKTQTYKIEDDVATLASFI